MQDLPVFTFIWQGRGIVSNDFIHEIFSDVPHVEVMEWDDEHALVTDHAIIVDHHLTAAHGAYYRRFADRNCFFGLLHIGDEWYKDNRQVYRHCPFVFRQHWAKLFESDPRIRVLPLGYGNGIVPNRPQRPAAERRHVWSFVGQITKSTRQAMYRAIQEVPGGFTHLTDDWAARNALPSSQYQAALEESVFVPCPLGNVNMECLRLYEALECGCIPIIERRTFFDYHRLLLGANPFPVVRQWQEAPGLIAALRAAPDRLETVRRDCAGWWQARKQALKEEIPRFLAETLARRGEQRPPIALPFSGPGIGWVWRHAELAKHDPTGYPVHAVNGFLEKTGRRLARARVRAG